MATQDEINAHDALITQLAKRFARGLGPLLTELYDNISTTSNLDRLAVNRLMLPVRNYAEAQIANINTVIDNNRSMNADIFADVFVDTSRIRAEAVAALNNSIDEEVNRITNVLAAALLIGAVSAVTFRELRNSKSAITRRLQLNFDNIVRMADSAFTFLAGQASNKSVKYRYAGGIVPETRPFCSQMNGRILSQAEITRIWNTQTWAGKRPGNAFVTRGGYNCRHFFVPVGEDE